MGVGIACIRNDPSASKVMVNVSDMLAKPPAIWIAFLNDAGNPLGGGLFCAVSFVTPKPEQTAWISVGISTTTGVALCNVRGVPADPGTLGRITIAPTD